MAVRAQARPLRRPTEHKEGDLRLHRCVEDHSLTPTEGNTTYSTLLRMSPWEETPLYSTGLTSLCAQDCSLSWTAAGPPSLDLILLFLLTNPSVTFTLYRSSKRAQWTAGWAEHLPGQTEVFERMKRDPFAAPPPPRVL